MGITVLLDLDGYFKGGERPYTYIIDGRNLEVSSENELIYNGGGLLDTRGTATIVASDADGDSVTAALTLAFSIPVGFVPATVTQTIAAGYVGAVYAAAARGSHDPIAWINDKLWVGTRVLNRAYGEFDYSIVTPAYDTAGRAVSVSSSRQTVSLGQGLAAGSRLTVTVVAQGAVLRNNPWRASLDLILVAAPAPSATLSAWFTQLRTGEGNRAVASLHTSGYPNPVASLVAGGDAFAYLPEGMLLSVSVTRNLFTYERAVLEVSDRGLGWPPVRVTHAVAWLDSVSPEQAMYLVGGGDASSAAKNDVWRSTNGMAWEKVCDPCFSAGGTDYAQEDHAVAVHGGSLWLVGGADDPNVYRSGNGGHWESVGRFTEVADQAELVSHLGTLWLLGGRGGDDSHLGSAYYWDGNGFVLETANAFPPRSQHAAASFMGSLWVIGGLGGSGDSASVILDIWASANGAVWTQVTASSPLGRRLDSRAVVHGNKLYLSGGDSTKSTGDSWVSSDGVSWMPSHSSATPFSQSSEHGFVSYNGSLFYMPASRDSPTVYSSPDGGTWTLVGVANFGHRNEMRVAVLGTAAVGSGVEEVFEVAVADLSLAGTLEAAHAIPVAATTPMALGTLSVSGGRGSYSAVVRQTGGALAVDLNGGVAVVRLVSVGASGTEIRATLAVDDGIPGGAVERVITVLFYAPAAYAPSLVTVDVAAQALLWQRAYAVPATGGFGEGFRYSVLTVVGDKPVSVDMERGVVWLDTDDGGRLGSGKTLTAEIEATDVRVESNRAVLTVVMAGSIFPTFSEFDVQDGSRLVYFIKVGTTALVRQGLGVRGGGSPVVTMESAAAENYEHKVGGILSLTVAQDSPTVHRLTLHTYDSGQPAATRVTVSRVLTVVIHHPLQGVPQPPSFVVRTLPAGASVGMATVGGGGGSVTWSKAGGDANNLLTVRSDGRIGLVRQPTSGVGRGFYLEVQKVIRAEDEAGDSQTATVNVQFHRPLRWGNASRLRVIAGESVRSIDVPTDIGTHALFDFSNGARGGFDLSSTVRVIEAALTQHLTTPPFNIELEDGPGNLRIIPTSSNERVDHEARSRMRWSVNPINSYIKFEVVSWYTDFTGTRVTARATFRAVARGPVSLVSPLGSRNLLAGTAITQTVIADLSSHLHGGLPTYRGVADDAALTVSAGALLYVGGARAAGSVLTVTMALSDYLVAGHVNATVRTGVTLRFRPAVSFDAATVTKRIGAGFVGAVFAPTVAGGSDSFSFTMTQPVYGDGGRTVTAGIAGGTVTLGTSLAVDERATMTVAVTDATGGAMASLLVVLEAAAVTAAVTGYYDSLSVGDNRPVAGVSVSGFEGVSVRVEGGGGVFRYVPGTTPDEGGFLWGSSGESVEAMATLVVGSRLLGWPEVTLGYAAGWSAVGNLFLIGGSGQATDGGALLARADVWYSSNGSSWTRRCENCFGVADVRGHSAASYRGSLWVVGGVGDFRVYRSADGRVWDTVMSLPGSLPDRNHQLVGASGDFVADWRGV